MQQIKENLEILLLELEAGQQGELDLDNPNTVGAKAKRGLSKIASKVGTAVKSAAKSTAKNISNKVTAEKLLKSWKLAGKPTDAGSVAEILRDAGLSNDQIQQISKVKNVELPNTSINTSTSGTTTNTDSNMQTTNPALKALADKINKAGVSDLVKPLLQV